MADFSCNAEKILDVQVGVSREGLSMKRLKNFASMPLAEQHRIVAKVDELMALCDQLEARLTTAQDLRQNLTEAVLHPNHLQLAHN